MHPRYLMQFSLKYSQEVPYHSTSQAMYMGRVCVSSLVHDDVIKWKLSALLAICAGNSLVTCESPHKGQWHGVLMFSLIWAWMNGWVNKREAGDLRRHRAHYDATVMKFEEMVSYSASCEFTGKSESGSTGLLSCCMQYRVMFDRVIQSRLFLVTYLR